MSFITKRHLSRRTFLRGTGVSLALPLLDSMVPAGTLLAQTAAAPTTRLGCRSSENWNARPSPEGVHLSIVAPCGM